jgi:hypothetical protein
MLLAVEQAMMLLSPSMTPSSPKACRYATETADNRLTIDAPQITTCMRYVCVPRIYNLRDSVRNHPTLKGAPRLCLGCRGHSKTDPSLPSSSLPPPPPITIPTTIMIMMIIPLPTCLRREATSLSKSRRFVLPLRLIVVIIIIFVINIMVA